MPSLWKLFVVFARIGGVTFGGGMAMLPILQSDIVERYHWATEEELTDYYAVGQCTPGIIAVNVATFIGYKERGIIGGIVATLGVVFPSLVIISILAAGLANLADYPAVKDAFAGIRVCVCILIFNAVSKLARSAIVDWLTIGVFLVVLGINLFTDVSPVMLVIFAGMVGLWGKLGLKK